MGKALTHGWRRPENARLYSRCNNIRLRCHDPKNKFFHHYGDRFNSTRGKLPDVHLCKEWHKPNIMCDWIQENLGWPIVLDKKINDPKVIGVNINEPSIKVELDRIDNNGSYEPENIAWVSKSKNHLNRRDSHGKTRTPVFNEWQWIRIQVKKGKAKCDPRWDCRGSHSHGTRGFKAFIKDMGDQYELMKEMVGCENTKWMIARIEEEWPYSWENCVWVKNLGNRRFCPDEAHFWHNYLQSDEYLSYLPDQEMDIEQREWTNDVYITPPPLTPYQRKHLLKCGFDPDFSGFFDSIPD